MFNNIRGNNFFNCYALLGTTGTEVEAETENVKEEIEKPELQQTTPATDG